MTDENRRSIVDSINEAKNLHQEIREFLPATVLMEDRYVDLEPLIREVDLSAPDLMEGPEKSNLGAMLAEELLPLLADEHGIHLIGICARRLDGTKNEATGLFNHIEEFLRTADMDESKTRRTFLVIPEHIFRTIVEKRLISSQEKRRSYLGEIENEEPILAFIGIVLKAIALGASDIHIENDDYLPAPIILQSPLGDELSKKTPDEFVSGYKELCRLEITSCPSLS